jgi:hypothetical protein
METNQERMETKTDTVINTNQERLDTTETRSSNVGPSVAVAVKLVALLE